MFSRSSWLHLRIPFSYFLLPIFLFSLSVSPNFSESRLLWVFIILHLLLYPASNGYNSYFDKDEKSIGGLKHPPPVRRGLYSLALLLDVLAIVIGFLKINLSFAIMLFVYGMVSKAYSHPSLRLKKYPVVGWLVTGLFQGLFTFVMCYVGINNFTIGHALKAEVVFAGLLTSIMLWANYPMTQVYQHEEDASRGDRTISLMLGIKGTFFFTGAVFLLATIGFVAFFNTYMQLKYAAIFMIALLPVLIFFLAWFLKVLKDERYADFTRTMWLNFISATSLNAFFLYLFLDRTQVIQALQGGF